MESPFCGPELIAQDQGFYLFETFTYVSGQPIARLSLHLNRIAQSARTFAIPFDRQAALALLNDLSFETPKRCRMTLSQEGLLSLETAPMPAGKPYWQFAIAPERISSKDPFLLHKSSRRALYTEARARLPDGVDEWLFLNEREELCEGTITNLVLETTAGERLTPPLSSGCLPGVFRQSLLDKAELREAVITQEDLKGARSIWLTNSLRGRIESRWSPDCSFLGDPA